ncbi:MAG TPA: OmpA family protein [Bryobacteraceae bacterium]|nr:OmpA family protein [Bryobacteraceae bacterium]
MKLLTFVPLLVISSVAVFGQETNPTQTINQPKAGSSQQNPIFRVEVVSRSIAAISYRNRSGSTKVDFQGTSLAQKAKGRAEVTSRLGHTEVKVEIKGLPAARQFGPLFLTYVLWAITPDGRPANLGEVVVNSSGDFKATVTTDFQAFGLIVTAEPYFGVRQPSDVVVMENIVRGDTLGKIGAIDAKYELLPRGQYEYHIPESQLKPVDLNSDKKSPLAVYEAVNAVQIAQYAKSDQYAADIFTDAGKLLKQAQDYRDRKQWGPSIMTAKEAVQKAEDARTISLRRQRDEALQQERAAAAAREAAEKQKAADARARAAQEGVQRAEAEANARHEADQRALADAARKQADAARAQADAEALKAQQAGAEADRLRLQAENEKNQLRQTLLQQFNAVLPTRETPRGLVVNMQDVLFDTGKYDLKSTAREALARISGIVLSHPGLNLQIEGYTDSTGTAELNQKLSEQRANAVRDYLMNQGLSTNGLSAVGYGLNYPVAPNDTASGRKQNRRVELVVSGEVIGVKLGVPPSQTSPPTQVTVPVPPQR